MLQFLQINDKKSIHLPTSELVFVLSELASKVYVTHISCRKKDLPLIVEEWIQREGRSRGWYWAQKHGDGYLVEAHIDGEGRSYLSGMVSKDRKDGIIPCLNNDLVVEVGRSSVHTLVIEHDDAYKAKPDYLRPSEKMHQVVLDPSPYFLASALICFLISVATLFVAISARPPVEPVVVPDVPVEKTPTQWWDENAHWSRSEVPVTVRYGKDGAWVLETEEFSDAD